MKKFSITNIKNTLGTGFSISKQRVITFFSYLKKGLQCKTQKQKLKRWKKITLFVSASLILSILLNIGAGLYRNYQLREKEQHIQEKIQELETLNEEFDKTTQELEEHKITEKEYKNKIETLKKEKEDLNQKLQAKLEEKKKAEQIAAANRAQATSRASQPVYNPSGTCEQWIRQAGVAESDISAAYTLIMKESGCSVNSYNRSSGACGIPQALPCSKLGSARGNPVAEIRWMSNYVRSRYGGWQQALNFHYSHNWY